MSTLVLLLLTLVTVLAALALVAGVVGAWSGRLPFLPAAGRPASLLVALVAGTVLAANLWAGWSGPWGSVGLRAKPRPDVVPRAHIGVGRAGQLAAVANAAVGASNRGVRTRVTPAPDFRDPEAPALWLAANDAPTPAAMREQILADAWRVYYAVFQDPAFGSLRSLRLVVTHPAGRRVHPSLEPTVAVIELSREGFRRINPLRRPAAELPREASIRWLPPLGAASRAR